MQLLRTRQDHVILQIPTDLAEEPAYGYVIFELSKTNRPLN